MLTFLDLGHPLLRQAASPVTDVADPCLHDTAAAMAAHIVEAGLAVAAPQIGVGSAFFVYRTKPSPLFPGEPVRAAQCIVNPRILTRSPETVSWWEYCLSFPNLRVLVSRSRKIRVSYQTLDGASATEELTDFQAYIFQHEADHLEGILSLDRARSTKDIMAEAEFQRVRAFDPTVYGTIEVPAPAAR